MLGNKAITIMTTLTLNGKNTLVHQESEKAICVLFAGTTAMVGGSTVTFKSWIPKSVIKDGTVATWFMSKLCKEKHLMTVGIVPILN